MSAFFKIPLQALILLTGVLMFAFYLFVQPPMLFNPAHQARGRGERRARPSIQAARARFDAAFDDATAGGAGAGRRRRAPTAASPRRADGVRDVDAG